MKTNLYVITDTKAKLTDSISSILKEPTRHKIQSCGGVSLAKQPKMKLRLATASVGQEKGSVVLFAFVSVIT